MAPTPSMDDLKIQENVRSRDLAPQNEDRHEFSRGHEHRPTLTHPRWNPRFWTRKVWIGFAAINMMATVLVVSAAVARTREGSSYPDYSPLTYTLKDTCTLLLHYRISPGDIGRIHEPRRLTPASDSGESFFDHFNYKTGDDPSIQHT